MLWIPIGIDIERQRHEEIILVGRNLADVMLPVICPPLCLAHSLGTAYATVAVASFSERFTACIFIEGFAGFGLTYAVDFGAAVDGEEEDRQVTAAPESLRRSLSAGLAAISS